MGGTVGRTPGGLTTGRGRGVLGLGGLRACEGVFYPDPQFPPKNICWRKSTTSKNHIETNWPLFHEKISAVACKFSRQNTVSKLLMHIVVFSRFFFLFLTPLFSRDFSIFVSQRFHDFFLLLTPRFSQFFLFLTPTFSPVLFLGVFMRLLPAAGI